PRRRRVRRDDLGPLLPGRRHGVGRDRRAAQALLDAVRRTRRCRARAPPVRGARHRRRAGGRLMVLVLAVLVGLALGRLLGGRVSALAAIPIRAPWLFYAAIGLQIAG